MRRALASFAAVLLLASSLQAQEVAGPAPLLLPGSINASVGTVGPLEPGNVLASVTAGQGVSPWHRGPLFIVGFVDVTVRVDSAGLTWNNTAPAMAGVKVVVAGRYGVWQTALGAAGDLRSASRTPLTAAGYSTYWAGWQRPTTRVNFPGHTWASSGIVTALEPRNWITSGHVQQGVTAYRGRHFSLVPFVGLTGSVDTEARPWNNRGFVDGGVKATTRIGSAALEGGVAHRTTREWASRDVSAGTVVFANLWVGWTPRVVR